VGADEAQLSAFPQQVQVLVALAVQLSDPGPDKVSALRQAVAGGAYQPDVQKVAGALFASLALNRAA
jgi:anti-sigma28 factor (negative regulator of flagellin synthesis)